MANAGKIGIKKLLLSLWW